MCMYIYYRIYNIYININIYIYIYIYICVCIKMKMQVFGQLISAKGLSSGESFNFKLNVKDLQWQCA